MAYHLQTSQRAVLLDYRLRYLEGVRYYLLPLRLRLLLDHHHLLLRHHRRRLGLHSLRWPALTCQQSRPS